MNSIAKIASLIALVVTIAPSCIYFLGALDLDFAKWITLAGTIAWFIATPMWMGREAEVDDMEVQI
jgi:CHASE2 domain-containing sensor protein